MDANLNREFLFLKHVIDVQLDQDNISYEKCFTGIDLSAAICREKFRMRLAVLEIQKLNTSE